MDQAWSLLETIAAKEGANQAKVCELREAVRELRSYASVISSSRCQPASDTSSWTDELDSWLNSEELAVFENATNGWPFIT